MKRAPWTKEQVAILRRHYADSRTEDIAFMVGRSTESVFQKAYALGLAKSEAYLASPAACRLRGGAGTSTRFPKGQVPWNKGISFHAGGGAPGRQFKAGQSPANTLPIGSFRMDANQTLFQKVSNASGNNSVRWRAVHELVWVDAHGPIPEKHLAVFKPGMKTNVFAEITLDKIECISLAENMRRNSRHNLPKELDNLISLKAALTRQINKREKP